MNNKCEKEIYVQEATISTDMTERPSPADLFQYSRNGPTSTTLWV